MNFPAVLEWVKANVFIVVFVVIMIAAPIGMFFVSSGMNEAVRKEVSARAQKINELSSLNGYTFEIFNQTHTGIPNERLMDRVAALAHGVKSDAESVHQAAVEHNRKGRSVIRPDILPNMPQTQRDVLPEKFHGSLVDAYNQLLEEVKAGTPPHLDSLKQSLLLSKSTFITQDLKKDPAEKLEGEELSRLTEHLTNARMSLYAEAADKIGLYVSPSELAVPAWDKARQPSIGELYIWQWQLWVVQDVLKALYAANGDQTVRHAPVKQVLRLSVRNLPTAPDGVTGPGGSPAGTTKLGAGNAGGFGGADPGAGGPQEDPSAPAPTVGGVPADPKLPLTPDYAVSFTGRTSNPLYDVIYVTLDLVVDTVRLPQVLDALAKYNFMTVIGLQISPGDPFAAAQGGFLYGSGAVSTVRMEIETIWLREWMTQFMPVSIKQVLGVGAGSAQESAPEPVM